MVITLNKKYRITSNRHCWQLEQYMGKRKSGEERWEPVTYHVDFDGALKEAFDLQVRLIDSSDPQEILECINTIRAEILDSVGVFKLAV